MEHFVNETPPFFIYFTENMKMEDSIAANYMHEDKEPPHFANKKGELRGEDGYGKKQKIETKRSNMLTYKGNEGIIYKNKQHKRSVQIWACLRQ